MFKIGEKALVVAKPNECTDGFDRYIGTEVLITSELHPLDSFAGREIHNVQMCDGATGCATPNALQKIPPPREPCIKWKDCIWQPKELANAGS